MKYLITESQKENVIKRYILSNFDRVDDVWFTTREYEIIINVLVNNLDDELSKKNLFDLKENIINKANNTFNLGYYRPLGGWGFSFSQKVIEKF